MIGNYITSALRNFARHIDLNPLYFLLARHIVLGTCGNHTVLVARASPIPALRYA